MYTDSIVVSVQVHRDRHVLPLLSPGRVFVANREQNVGKEFGYLLNNLLSLCSHHRYDPSINLSFVLHLRLTQPTSGRLTWISC